MLTLMLGALTLMHAPGRPPRPRPPPAESILTKLLPHSTPAILSHRARPYMLTLT